MGFYVRRDTICLIAGIWIHLLMAFSCPPGYAQPDISMHSQALVLGYERETVDERISMDLSWSPIPLLPLAGRALFWRGLPRIDLGAKVENYTHDKTGREALYTSGFLTCYIGEQSQAGGEIGLMNGDQPKNSFHLGRLWFNWNVPFDTMPTDVITGDVVYASYEEKSFEEDTSLFLSIGVGRSFIAEALSLKLSGDCSDDPHFDSNTRVMVTLTYNLNP